MPARRRPGDAPARPYALQLTEPERQVLRAALKGLRHRLGSWRAVSEATGIPVNTLWGISRGTDYGSTRVAEKVARAIGVRVTVLLSGTVYDTDVCPTCGQRLLARRPA